MAELIFPSSPNDGDEYQGYKWNLTDKVWVNIKSGVTVDVVVGSTTQVDSDQVAKVTNTGDQYNVKLDFEIPKGEQGIQGVPGNDGDIKVESVNGEEGAVVLDSGDVGALPINILDLPNY